VHRTNLLFDELLNAIVDDRRLSRTESTKSECVCRFRPTDSKDSMIFQRQWIVRGSDRTVSTALRRPGRALA
jgi:hypothetical protein